MASIPFSSLVSSTSRFLHPNNYRAFFKSILLPLLQLFLSHCYSCKDIKGLEKGKPPHSGFAFKDLLICWPLRDMLHSIYSIRQTAYTGTSFTSMYGFILHLKNKCQWMSVELKWTNWVHIYLLANQSLAVSTTSLYIVQNVGEGLDKCCATNTKCHQ